MEEGRRYERWVLEKLPAFFDEMVDAPFKIRSVREMPLIRSNRKVWVAKDDEYFEYFSPVGGTMDGLARGQRKGATDAYDGESVFSSLWRGKVFVVERGACPHAALPE